MSWMIQNWILFHLPRHEIDIIHFVSIYRSEVFLLRQEVFHLISIYFEIQCEIDRMFCARPI